MNHKILEVAPVQALMLITKWKNEAEHKRALGYTPIDTTETIRAVR